jgi:superfamily II DNA or RNA helicase
MEFREKIQKEAYETSLLYKKGTFSISMRLGKTLIGLKISTRFKNVLVLYPNNSIKNSWLEDAEKFDIDINNITFSTFLSLNKFNLDDYDCIIIDELQDFSINNYEYLFNFNIKNLYSLTGTPPLKGDKKYLMNAICPIIYTVKLDETTGKTNKDYKITVHLLEPSKIKNKPLKSGAKWSEFDQINFWEKQYLKNKDFQTMLNLMRCISNSETKFNYMINLQKKLGKTLIFVETKKQCELSKLHSYYSDNKKSEENLDSFLDNKIDKLVTINQLRAGITFKDLNTCIILHSYSSDSKSTQKIGRALNYVEDVIADIHILCLKGTRDESWVNNSLINFDKNKIEWK